MKLIKPLVNRTHGETEPHFFVASYYIMDPRAVYSFSPATARDVTNHGMSSVRIIIS